jgi:hypothetical protein
MQPLLQPEDTPEDICTILPPSATDISVRPITVVRAYKLASLPCSDHSKSALLRVAETLRLHTLYTNMASNNQGDGQPVLQVAMILDMANVSVYAFVCLDSALICCDVGSRLVGYQDIELLRWFTNDAYPRFPGLVGPSRPYVLLYSVYAYRALSLRCQLLVDSRGHMECGEVSQIF